MDTLLVKVINDGAAYEAAPSVIKLPGVTINNPSESVLNKLNYWPLEESEAPTGENVKVIDDGYSYVDLDDGTKKVVHTFRTLEIVDAGEPELEEGQILYRDYWETTDTQYIHHYVVLNVIDEQPELAEGQEIIDTSWNIDEDAGTKTKVYVVVTRISEEPELAEGQEIVERWWEDTEPGVQTERFVVMNVVRPNTELQEGQQVVDSWFEDDPETNTRTYHEEVRAVVDEEPTLEENQEITCEWWDDDGVTRTHKYEITTTIDEPPVLNADEDIVGDDWQVEQIDETHIKRTRIYQVRKIVDAGAPELGENEFIYNEYWNDDGDTRTHVYVVWTRQDEAVPEYDQTQYRLVDLGIQDDPEAKTRGKKYFLKPIENNKPADDENGNFKYVFDYEEDTGSKIIIHYKKVDKIWRTFSKLKIEFALFQMGKLSTLNAWIDGQTLTSPGGETSSLRHFYDLANDLSENHQLFKPYFSAACAALGMTEDAASALLEQCKVG